MVYLRTHAYFFNNDPFLATALALGRINTMRKFDCITAMKALGEETRLRIVRMLLKKQCSVNEIAETLGITQYNASKHLRVLSTAGLAECEKQGQQRLYRLASDLSSHLKKNNDVLDLGCCQFDFSKLPE